MKKSRKLSSLSKTVVTLIISLSMLLTTACGKSEPNQSTGIQDILNSLTNRPAESANIADTASETDEEEFATATLDEFYDCIKDANEQMIAANTRIPMILNAECKWIDQNGNIMEDEAAEQFFRHNPSLEREIIYLNWNHLYATKLYEVGRQDYLDQYQSVGLDLSTEYVRTSTLCIIYNAALNNTQISDKDLFVLNDHFSNNAAAKDVAHVYEDLDSVRYGKDIGYHTNNAGLIRRLYFTCLADFTATGKFDEVCLNSEAEVPSIPVLLSDDGIWYDQNLDVVDGAAVDEFFEKYESQANRIIMLNFACNPFLTTDNLDSELRDELKERIPKSYSSYGGYDICLVVLNEIVADLPTSDSFEYLSSLIQETATDIYRCNRTLEYVTELQNITESQRTAMQAYGFEGDSADLVEYLFVITLANLVENGATL